MTTKTTGASSPPTMVTSPAPPATAVAATGPLPDLPAHGLPPEDWSRAEPLEIRDETGSGCTGLGLGVWLRLTCPGFTQAWAVRGHRITQTRIETVGANVTITTLYVPGTDLQVGLAGGRGHFAAAIRWLGPARPRRAAMITSERNMLLPDGDF